MSLERNTAIARAAYEAERAYVAATEGPQAQGAPWGFLFRDAVERQRLRVIEYRDSRAASYEPQEVVWRRVVNVMAEALEP